MINVQFMDMPSKIKATHTLNEDGSYTIFINSRLSDIQQKDGYIHEIKHILNEDFYSKYEADCLEYLAHIG